MSKIAKKLLPSCKPKSGQASEAIALSKAQLQSIMGAGARTRWGSMF